MTTPSVPPYSSVTMAIWNPPRRSSPSRVSAPIDRGTNRGWTASSSAVAPSRSAAGSAKACFTWTTPRMSSESSPITGKREKPERWDSATISVAVSSWWTLVIRTRGVITSSAEWSENRSVRLSSVAWSWSSSPSSAERRTSELSSSADRAPESSSFGSMPMDRMTALAVLLNNRISGLNTVVKNVWNGTTTLAVRSGSARAKFFGTSSPSTIDSSVATATPTTRADPRDARLGQPEGGERAVSNRLIAGSIV